jgi:hypothetical protein
MTDPEAQQYSVARNWDGGVSEQSQKAYLRVSSRGAFIDGDKPPPAEAYAPQPWATA